MQQNELLDLFETAQSTQLALCDKLEEIADSLPHTVDRQACIHTARALSSVVERAHRIEEDVFFPLLEESEKFIFDPTATLERLRMEHAGDSYLAEELVDVLMAFGAGGAAQGPEVVGYMLRGFFQSLRRHLAFEQELLRPYIAQLSAGESKVH